MTAVGQVQAYHQHLWTAPLTRGLIAICTMCALGPMNIRREEKHDHSQSHIEAESQTF